MFGLKGLAFNLKDNIEELTLMVLNKVTFSIARHWSKFPVECDIESRAILMEMFHSNPHLIRYCFI